MAQKAKITLKIATSTNMKGENVGVPSRKERMRSDPFERGLISANVTRGAKPLDSRVFMIVIG